MPVRFTPPRCPKPALWPETDRERWENLRRTADILEPRDVGADWAPHTRSRIEDGHDKVYIFNEAHFQHHVRLV